MMYCPPFFDEDGMEHDHDRNVTTADYQCSRGHKFTQSRGHRCWCGWTIRGMEAVTVLE